MKTKLLSSIPLFSGLPPEEIDHLAESLQTIIFPAGTVLFEEGGSDPHCFILQEGTVEIIKSLGTSDERTLAVRGRGSLLGEMSLFMLSKAHTASVRSLTPLTLLKMTRTEFDGLLHRQPRLVYEIAEILSRRLDESENLTILDLRAKNIQLTDAYEELKSAHEQIVEKERMERELQIAQQIQLSILPQEIPQYPGVECGALMIPARMIGGDFYDFFPLGEDLLGVVVGDVSDKGVPAALFMALTYSLVRAEARHNSDPAETLRGVNRHLLEINVSQMFVTLLYGVLDTRTGRFLYPRAGHPPPFLIDSSCSQLPVSTKLGQALGLLDEPMLDEGQIQLPEGGCLMLFSDGLTEAEDLHGEFFELERLCEIRAEHGQADLSDFCQEVWRAVQDFSSGLTQADDFTFTVIKWEPG